MRNNQVTTPMFWNCLGIAIAILSSGMSFSIIRNKGFELQFAEYRLRNGQALNKVQQVSDTLEQSVERLPIDKVKREQLKQQLEESNAVLEKAESQIYNEIPDLSEPIIELPPN